MKPDRLQVITAKLDAAIADKSFPPVEPITPTELKDARLTPREILGRLLYAEVRTRIAAGGTGKTTLALFEAVTLALGRDLWGRSPSRPVTTVLITREDSREILVARLREIMCSMLLSQLEIERVLARVSIIDLSGKPFRLSAVTSDMVMPHEYNIGELCETLAPLKPDWVIFDPLVSFGVGEARVNDAEQGLIEAFRLMRNRLDCCIEGIHHSGKLNSREKTLDQYSGRGGSALSDGSRMVAVLQPLDAAEWQKATGTMLDLGESGLVMALPKLSFSKPQDNIYIRRSGYSFTRQDVSTLTPEQQSNKQAAELLTFIKNEYAKGRRYSASDLEAVRDKVNLSRSQVRASLTVLKVAGFIVYREVKGKSGSHFEPLGVKS